VLSKPCYKVVTPDVWVSSLTCIELYFSVFSTNGDIKTQPSLGRFSAEFELMYRHFLRITIKPSCGEAVLLNLLFKLHYSQAEYNYSSLSEIVDIQP